MIIDKSFIKWKYYKDSVICRVYLTMCLMASEQDEVTKNVLYPRGTVKSMAMVALMSGLSVSTVTNAILRLEGEELTVIRKDGKIRFCVVNPYKTECSDKHTMVALRNARRIANYMKSKCPCMDIDEIQVKNILMKYSVEDVIKVVDFSYREKGTIDHKWLFVPKNFKDTLERTGGVGYTKNNMPEE